MIKVKQCSKCKRVLEVSNFHLNKSRKGGYHHYCKQCRKEQDSISRISKKAMQMHNENKQKLIDEVNQLIVEIESKPTLWQRFINWLF